MIPPNLEFFFSPRRFLALPPYPPQTAAITGCLPFLPWNHALRVPARRTRRRQQIPLPSMLAADRDPGVIRLISHAPADPAPPPGTTLIPSPSPMLASPPRPPSARLAIVATSVALALPSSPSASSAATPGLEPLADRVPPRPSLLSVRRLLSDSSSAAPPGREPIADRRASRSWGASNRAPLLRGSLPPSSSPGAYLRPSSSAAAGDSRVPGMRIEVRYNSCVAT